MAYQRQILFGAEKRGPFLLFFWSVNSRFCRSGGKLLWRFGLRQNRNNPRIIISHCRATVLSAETSVCWCCESVPQRRTGSCRLLPSASSVTFSRVLTSRDLKSLKYWPSQRHDVSRLRVSVHAAHSHMHDNTGRDQLKQCHVFGVS